MQCHIVRLNDFLIVLKSGGLFAGEIFGDFANHAVFVDFQLYFDCLTVLFPQYVALVFEEVVEVQVRKISIQLFQPHVTFCVRIAAIRSKLRKCSLRLMQGVKIEKRDVSAVHFIRQAVLFYDLTFELNISQLKLISLLVTSPDFLIIAQERFDMRANFRFQILWLVILIIGLRLRLLLDLRPDVWFVEHVLEWVLATTVTF